MLEHGIWAPVLPEVTADGTARLAALAAREAAAGVEPDGVRRLAALVPHAAADAVGARLRLSNADRKRLAAAGAGLGDEGPRALAYRVGIASALDRLLLAGEDAGALADWTPPALPISGGALVARGLGRGPEVARALRDLERWWIAAGFPPAIPDAVVDQALGGATRA
jgi:poly(A) polymerase